MRRRSVSYFVITFVLFFQNSYAAKKTSVEASLLEQARQAIAVDPNIKVPHSSSPQDTGILVMRAPDLNDDRYPTRFPVGFHLDSYSLSGTATTSNNAIYNFSDLGSPLVPSLSLGLVPWAPVVFDSYTLQIGYQQKQISTNVDQSLKLAHYVASISGENKFYVRGKMDLRYQIELGLLQSQISSKENSLSNVTQKSSFVGIGLQTKYHFHTAVSADLELMYRSSIAKSADYNIQPIGVGAGISYIW